MQTLFNPIVDSAYAPHLHAMAMGMRKTFDATFAAYFKSKPVGYISTKAYFGLCDSLRASMARNNQFVISYHLGTSFKSTGRPKPAIK